MRKLIFYEVRKHFLTPAMILIFLFLLMADACKIYSVYQEFSLFSGSNLAEFKKIYETFYPVYCGEITPEKIDHLLGIYRPIYETVRNQTASTQKDESSYTYNVYSDELFFRKCFVEEMEYDYTYRSYAAGIVSEAKKNIDFYKEWGNTYEYRKNLYIARAFHGRQIKDFYSTEMYQSLLYYDFSSILLLMLMVYGCASVFVKEEETEMKYIIRTSRNGRGRTYLAKIFSAFLFLTAMCILFAIWDFCMFSFFFGGTESTGSPLFAVRGFQDTLLNLSMGQGYLLLTIYKMAGLCVLCMIFLLFSLAARRILTALLLNFIFIIVCVSAYDHIYNSSRLWNPISLICGRNLVLRPDFSNMAGYPLPQHMTAAGGAAFLLIGLVYAGWVLWRGR